MATGEPFDIASFAAAYQELALAVVRAAPPKPAPFAELLEDHLGVETTDLSVVSITLDVFDQPNLQRAVDALGAEDDVEVLRTVGIRGQHRMFGQVTLATLTQGALNLRSGWSTTWSATSTPTRRSPASTSGCSCFASGRPVTPCSCAAWTSAWARRACTWRSSVPTARRHRSSRPPPGPDGRVQRLPGQGRDPDAVGRHAQHARSVLRRPTRHPAFRRDPAQRRPGAGRTHHRPLLGAGGVAPGRRPPPPRGVLLHGPPGTGKTHTVRYLMSCLTDRTVFVLSGQGLGAIAKTVMLARTLQPAVVVLEDVDLVAEERTRPHAGTNPLLFELLNQMDGVEQDADIVFLLTTNRPDLLEPALAARPGRIDLAVEVPLPAAPERLRLLELYANGLRVDGVDWEQIVERTDGCSAAFLRELLRQAAMEGASEDGDAPRLDHAALVDVLADLTNAAQAMSLRLLRSAP